MENEQKGITSVAVVVAVIIVVAAGMGVYLFMKGQKTDTNTKTEKVTEESTEPKIEVTSQAGGTSMTITPTVDKNISGVITVTLNDVPEGTKIVAFIMNEQGNDNMEGTGPNIVRDTDGSDGWSAIYDTTIFENGVYNVVGLPAASGDDNPFLSVSAQVIIQN